MKIESFYVRVMFGLVWLKIISDTFWQIHDGTDVTVFTFILLTIGVIGLVSLIFKRKTSN
jgi:hypothetical protein